MNIRIIDLYIVIVTVLIFVGFFYVYYNFTVSAAVYSDHGTNSEVIVITANSANKIVYNTASHINTPENVRAVYVSSWVAGSHNLMSNIIDLVEKSDLNAVVIDIKDATGKISYQPQDPDLIVTGAGSNRIADIKTLIENLHSKEIYVIGRLTVFQDHHYAKYKPESALKKTSDGEIWLDRKGLAWLDPTKKDVWEYVRSVAWDAYNVGFDEINFDYIRYPSDGNMNDLNYNNVTGDTRRTNIRMFYEFIHDTFSETNVVTSADMFGMTTTNSDDLGIGQIFEDALLNFDYVAPMVYPSHYPHNFYGISEPAKEPGKVIQIALAGAIKKAQAIDVDIGKIRPWLQDFNLGATYTESMVRAQIDNANDLGIKSYLIWDPSNRYTDNAYINN